MRISTFCAAVGAVFSFASITGCGGGNATRVTADTRTGRAVITIKWPDRTAGTTSRLIPAGANSIRVTFLVGSITLQSKIIARPATSATFTDLPAGTLTVQAAAFPTTDATGNAQATADSSAVIVSGQKTPVNLTLATTIASVKITPDTIQFTGAPVTLTATAYDGPNATGNIVISGAWKWDNSNPGVLTLTPQGDKAIISPVSAGSSTVTATETESGKSFPKVINVAPLSQ